MIDIAKIGLGASISLVVGYLLFRLANAIFDDILKRVSKPITDFIAGLFKRMGAVASVILIAITVAVAASIAFWWPKVTPENSAAASPSVANQFNAVVPPENNSMTPSSVDSRMIASRSGSGSRAAISPIRVTDTPSSAAHRVLHPSPDTVEASPLRVTFIYSVVRDIASLPSIRSDHDISEGLNEGDLITVTRDTRWRDSRGADQVLAAGRYRVESDEAAAIAGGNLGHYRIAKLRRIQ